MKLNIPSAPSGIPCQKDFKFIKNGVTFRKLGPIEILNEGRQVCRADALVIKDSCVIEQLHVHVYGFSLTSDAMKELRGAAWKIFHAQTD